MTASATPQASFARALRERGLRVTNPRLAILATLADIGGHRSADEVVAALRQRDFQHARTTVYNALDDLARAGLVLAAPVGAGALRYEPSTERHHHFLCKNCGLILDVPITAGDALSELSEVEIAGAKVTEIDVVFRGECATCVGSESTGSAESLMSTSAMSQADDEVSDLPATETDDARSETNGFSGSPSHEEAGRLAGAF